MGSCRLSAANGDTPRGRATSRINVRSARPLGGALEQLVLALWSSACEPCDAGPFSRVGPGATRGLGRPQFSSEADPLPHVCDHGATQRDSLVLRKTYLAASTLRCRARDVDDGRARTGNPASTSRAYLLAKQVGQTAVKLLTGFIEGLAREEPRGQSPSQPGNDA